MRQCSPTLRHCAEWAHTPGLPSLDFMTHRDSEHYRWRHQGGLRKLDWNAHPGFCISILPHYASPGCSSLAITGKRGMCLREPLTVLSMVTQIFSFEPLHHGMGSSGASRSLERVPQRRWYNPVCSYKRGWWDQNWTIFQSRWRLSKVMQFIRASIFLICTIRMRRNTCPSCHNLVRPP